MMMLRPTMCLAVLALSGCGGGMSGSWSGPCDLEVTKVGDKHEVFDDATCEVEIGSTGDSGEGSVRISVSRQGKEAVRCDEYASIGTNTAGISNSGKCRIVSPELFGEAKCNDKASVSFGMTLLEDKMDLWMSVMNNSADALGACRDKRFESFGVQAREERPGKGGGGYVHVGKALRRK